MKKPEPQPGLVIKYDYLWSDEHQRGQQQGAKDRPCAVVSAMRRDESGNLVVLLCPITHSPAAQESGAVKIPIKLGHYLSLDDDQSWIRTNEFNEVEWSDPGIIPAKADQWEYGRLPKSLYQAMRDQLAENIRRHTIARVDRTFTGH